MASTHNRGSSQQIVNWDSPLSISILFSFLFLFPINSIQLSLQLSIAFSSSTSPSGLFMAQWPLGEHVLRHLAAVHGITWCHVATGAPGWRRGRAASRVFRWSLGSARSSTPQQRFWGPTSPRCTFVYHQSLAVAGLVWVPYKEHYQPLSNMIKHFQPSASSSPSSSAPNKHHMTIIVKHWSIIIDNHWPWLLLSPSTIIYNHQPSLINHDY